MRLILIVFNGINCTAQPPALTIYILSVPCGTRAAAGSAGYSCVLGYTNYNSSPGFVTFSFEWLSHDGLFILKK